MSTQQSSRSNFDGGSAFPYVYATEWSNGMPTALTVITGASLLDLYAGFAAVGLIVRGTGLNLPGPPQEVAKTAFIIGQAMLAERARLGLTL